MTEQTIQAQPDTSIVVEPTQVQAPTPQTPPMTPQGLGDAPIPNPLDFIPEEYRASEWATKYKSKEELFKGFDNMAKLVGKKQVVQGLQVPGETATPEELEVFYKSLGRPEAADKYAFSDIPVHEGFDLAGEKAGFAEVAFKNGLSQKQADSMFKEFVELQNEEFKAKQEITAKSFDEALKSTFGEDAQTSLGLAKRGAKALGIGNTLDAEGLSANPAVLKLCAELGKYVGEDSFENGSSASKETIIEEALRIQKSDLYIQGDKKAHQDVEALYKKAYSNG